jgi:hypothetical protein
LTDRTLARTIERLADFDAAVTAAGARLFYEFPPIPEETYRDRRADLVTIEQALRRTRIRLLNAPQEAVYPRSAFFDTTYHLTKDGSARRTQTFIARLAPRLALDD